MHRAAAAAALTAAGVSDFFNQLLRFHPIMKSSLDRLMLFLIGGYCFASFTHFFHNAEFCGDYPNLPGWI